MSDRTHDIFVSYAHADDEIPAGAKAGWVTTLVDELKKVLRRKLGQAGADIWMDHQLAANERVPGTVLARLRASRTVVLIMSPGYQRSSWCQRELLNFLVWQQSRKHSNNVFVVEVEPVPRAEWPPDLQELTPVRFWDQRFQDQAPRLMGYPVPSSDETSPYWLKVNDLAHLIARRLQAEQPARLEWSGQIVFLAETTDDLLDERDSVAAFLRQVGCEPVPASQYPRDSESAFLDAVRQDLGRAAFFVQLLGPHEGRQPIRSDISFVALQAREAARATAESGLPGFQWRSPSCVLDRVSRPGYGALLSASGVRVCGLEELKRELFSFINRDWLPEPTRVAIAHQDSIDPLRVCISVHERDRHIGLQVKDALSDCGVVSEFNAEPDSERAPADNRLAQFALLERCQGVVIVYGHSGKNWVTGQFMLSGKVMAKRSRGVWGALLSAPPPDKPLSPVRSAALMTFDCRTGFDPTLLGDFVQALRAGLAPTNVGSH